MARSLSSSESPVLRQIAGRLRFPFFSPRSRQNATGESARISKQQLLEIEATIDASLQRYRSREFHQFLNVLPDGIAICDEDNGIEFSNTALAAILQTTDSLEGKNLAELLLGDLPVVDRIPFLNANRSAVREIKRGPELEDSVWRISRHPVRSTDRNGCVWTVRDITQQKLAEDMRDHFVTSATHELRTPLANIRAYAETLLTNDDIDVDLEKQFVNTIDGEAARLSRLVDDLLNVNQLQAGSLALERHQVDLSRLVNEVEAKIRPLMLQKSLTFTLDIPPKVPQVSADKDKLSAALVNLLGNAAKYTQEGSVIFAIEVQPQMVLFHIEDTGMGIAEEEVPRLFDRFFRSDDNRVREIEGNGLGLSFTNDVFRLHGGRIEVHSELNKGSRFTATLPIPNQIQQL